MKKVSKSLALVAEKFSEVLQDTKYQTETGRQILNKYQSHIMANDINCILINNFLKEAKNVLYDKGVNKVFNTISLTINNNKYLWLLESACEYIENNTNTYNYLNRNACKLVRPLLDLDENNLITYIKAGALKNVMFVESFRNIKNSILKNQPIVEYNDIYDSTHPISFVEKNNNNILYFVIEGSIYKMDNNMNISEGRPTEVSNEFIQINKFLESEYITYNNETLTYKTKNFSISVSESNKINKVINDGKITVYTTEQMREQNALYINNLLPQNRGFIAEQLELMCKISENFNNIVLLNNVQKFNTIKGQFVIMENDNCEKCFAKSLTKSLTENYSNWTTVDNIYKIVTDIKKFYNIDLTEHYQSKINNVIKNIEDKESIGIRESLKENQIDERKQRVSMLTEKFKNDPAKLAMLSRIAQDLNTL